MKLKLFAFLALAAATTTFATTNPVGVSYIGMDFGYARLSGLGPDESVDGYVGRIGYNHNISGEGNVGLDFFPYLSYTRLSGTADLGHAQALGARVRAYVEHNAIRPFIQFDASYNWDQEIGESVHRGDSWGLAVGAGAEVPLSETFSLIYLVEWAGLEREIPNHFRFGLGAHKWVTEGVGLSLNYALAEGRIKEHIATLGINIRL